MDMPSPAEVPSAPPAVPSPELPPSPMDDMGMGDDMSDLGIDDMGIDDMGGEDIDTEVDMDNEDNDDSNEQVTFKSIQKLTGKLTQKIRTLESQEGITSEDIKYVINMVLSSFDLNELNEDDREDILSKFEEESEDLGDDDMDGEDLTDDSEVEDIQSDMDVEMGEGHDYNELPIRRSRFKKSHDEENFGNGAIFDSIFGESKVDKVLSKYFEVSKKEIVENRQKTAEKKSKSISEVRRQMKSVIKLTETIEQELSSQKFLEENAGAKIVGKTNKNNLVFENKGKEIKITPEGLLI
jgi:hypothetical protein